MERNCLDRLYQNVWDKIDIFEKNQLSRVYRETFESIFENLTEAQIAQIEEKGLELETMIGEWRSSTRTPEDLKLLAYSLKIKIYKHIQYQLRDIMVF